MSTTNIPSTSIYGAVAQHTTFTCFPRLPFEIQDKIWDYAGDGPRLVVFTIEKKRIQATGGQRSTLYDELQCTTPVPSLLHTCRGSRARARESYKLCFANHLRCGVYLNVEIDTLFMKSPNVLPLFLRHLNTASTDEIRGYNIQYLALAADKCINERYHSHIWDWSIEYLSKPLALARRFGGLKEVTCVSDAKCSQGRELRGLLKAHVDTKFAIQEEIWKIYEAVTPSLVVRKWSAPAINTDTLKQLKGRRGIIEN